MTAPVNNNSSPARIAAAADPARPRKRQAASAPTIHSVEEETPKKTSGSRDAQKAAPMAPKEKTIPHEKLTAGGILQYEREKRGEHIENIADYLRIRSAYLAALEQNRFRDLPGQVYVLGYARSYAEYLSLNPEQIVRQLKAEYLPYQRRPSQANSLVLMPPPSMGKKANPKMIAFGLGALIIGGIVISALQPAPKQAKLTPGTGLPNNDATMLGEMAAPVVAPTPANNNAKPAPPAVAPVVKPLAPTAGNPVPTVPVAMSPANTVTATANGVVMTANANSWVQVKDANGQIVYTKVMHAGESYNVPNAPGMKLTAGNLAGLQFTVNGKALPAAGSSGTVARDIPLTPDALDKSLSKFRASAGAQ